MIVANKRNLHGSFDVAQGPAISISRIGHNTTNNFVTGTIEVTARGKVDLSNVDTFYVHVFPENDVTVMEVTNQTPASITVGLLYSPNVDRTALRYLQIRC
jgi:hypothetical protein